MASSRTNTKASNGIETGTNNVHMDVSGDVLTITIDLSRDLGPSASGKSHVVGSTRGNVTLENGVSVGVNAYRKV